MKRNTMQRLALLILAAAVAFGTFTFGADNAYAASAKWKVGIDNPIYVGSPGTIWVYNENNLKSKATVYSVKSSAPKKCEVIKTVVNDKAYFSLQGKKAGKVKITVRFKTAKGKKYKRTKTISVKPYPNIVKKLLVNGKEITVNSKKNGISYTKDGVKKTKVKIDMTPAKGWKIQSVDANAYIYKPLSYKPVKATKKMVKGGDSISFPKKYDDLTVRITLVNKKDKTISYTIVFRR